MSNLVVDAVPRSQTGVASGMNANIRTVGGAIGGAVLGSVVTAGARADGLPVEAGYTHGFAVLAGCSAVAALIALIVPVPRAARAARCSRTRCATPSSRSSPPARSSARPRADD